MGWVPLALSTLAVTTLIALGGCREGRGAGAGSPAGGDSSPTAPGSSGTTPTGATSTGRGPPELPRGGRSVFPEHRIVAYYGAPQSEELGTLGEGSPSDAAERIPERASFYEREERPVLPAFELIATIATRAPGADGRHRNRQSEETIRDYLEAIREVRGLLILDIQPGRADFRDEVRALDELLAEPDVALALDPEWSMGPGEVPGQTIGSTDAVTVNDVSEHLADLVREHDLPTKPLIVHQFTPEMIRDKDELVARDEVPLVISVDGFGTKAAKRSKWRALHSDREGVYNAIKLFYKEDVGLLSPSELFELEPTPDMVIYE